MRHSLLLFSLLGLIFSLSSIPAFALNYDIPDWVKNTAKWYGEGAITDQEYVSSIEYLIERKIIKVPATENIDPNWLQNISNLQIGPDHPAYQEAQDFLSDYVSFDDNLDSKYLEEYKQWSRDEISKYQEYANSLENEIKRLKSQIKSLESELGQLNFEKTLNEIKHSNELNRKINEFNEILSKEEIKPQTTIKDQKINWRIADSKGNLYYWEMPIDSYENLVSSAPYLETLLLELPSGEVVKVIDHTKFVSQSFTNVIDSLYDNSLSDDDFLYEVWYVTSQLTTYSTEIGDHPRYALETLSRGGGDCEDTSILIADMLRSSKYTRHWNIQLVYFDAHNPSNPLDVNHVAVLVDTGKLSYIIESTAKDENAMNQWSGQHIVGWYYDV